MSITFLRGAALAACLAALCTAPAVSAAAVDSTPVPAQESAAPATADVPSESSAPIDPARLEAARKAVQYIFPAGTYARIMDRSLNGMMKPMMDSVGKIPLNDLAAIAGVSEKKLATMPGATLDELMAIMDPAFKERTAAMMPAMFKAMGGLFSEFEPAMQAGLARAYARQFDVRQLEDLNTFFATPTGRIYAGNSMVIFTDPEIMNSMQAFVPVMMKRMPEIMKDVQADLAKFPPRKTPDQLTKAERKRLAQLLGLPEK